MRVVPPPYRSYVLISLQQIVDNYRSVCAAVGPAVEVMAVVKADAYGHGAIEVSRALHAAGARWFAVSSVDEGVALRGAGLDEAHVLVMGGVLPHEYPAALASDLTLALHDLAHIPLFDAAARDAGRAVDYHLKIDSGMNRMGAPDSPAEILRTVSAATHARLGGLMTHFASAADYGSNQTLHQLEAFHAVEAVLREAGRAPAWIHTSSTNAIGYARREGWHNMVRAGHALYGYLSPARGEAPARVIDVHPALTWKAKILLVKDIPEGALVGYGGSFRAPRPMRIGVLGAGYADGVFHRLSNRGRVIAAGKLTPILGSVSMDLTTIDLSHAPHLAAGDEATLLGVEGDASLNAQQIARIAGTISYNILCGISARVHRVYV
jgi:alanine racemase